MVTKTQRVRLGIFIAIGSILIIVFAGVVAGSKLFERRDIYYVEFEDSSVHGLQVGGSVQYHGIKVGRVESIKINPQDVSKITLVISVEHGTPIKDDVKATLMYVGITGIKAVELIGGSKEAKLIKPKSEIPVGLSSFDSITGKAESIAEKVDLIAQNIANITNEQNQKNIAQILEQTSLILSETRENLTESLKSLNIIASNISDIAGSTSSNFATISESTNLLLQDSRKQINTIGEHSDQLVLQATKDIASITANINQSLSRINQIVNTTQFDSLIVNVNKISSKLAAADLKQLVTDLNLTINQTNSLVNNLDRTVTRGRTDLLETLESMREAAENLNDFTKQISENPSSLFIGK